MFKYPLIKPKNTVYHKLGISPVSTAGDIRDAKTDLITSLGEKKKKIEKRRRVVFSQIPELEKLTREVEQAHQQDSKCDPKELNRRHKELARLETEARKIEPGYLRLNQQLEEIDREINEINNLRLESPEVREKYDRSTPPCALLKISRPPFLLFSDRRVTMYLIREEIVRFLEKEKNSPCYHPSDLTRTDFTSDYIYNDLLDKK